MTARDSARAVAPAVLTHWAILLCFTYLISPGNRLLPQPVMLGAHAPFHPWPFNGLDNWDGVWFTKIAQFGYTSSVSMAFFPLFPTLIHLTGLPEWLAGATLANGAFAGACWLLHRLLRLDYDEPRCRNTIWLLALNPLSIFWSAVYSESLFLMLSVAAFWQLRRARPTIAGVLAGLACSCRLVGVVLWLPLLWECWNSRRSVRRLLSLTLPMALVAGLYPLYLQIHVHDALAFANAQRGWGRAADIPGFPLLRGLGELLPGPNRRNDVARIDLPLVLLYLAAMGLATRRRIRPSYLLYGWSLLLLVLSNRSVTLGALYSSARACMVAFPIYLALADLPPRGLELLRSLFLAGYGFCVGFFLLGLWVD